MTVEVMYALTAFVCMMAVCLILNRTSATTYKETIDRPFVKLLLFFILFSFVDFIWGVLFSREIVNIPWLLLLFSYFFHIMSGLSALMWTGYLVDYLGVPKQEKRLLNGLRFLLFGIQECILIYNIPTSKAFLVNELGEYHSFPLRKVLFYLQFASYVVMFIYTFVKLPLSRKENIPKFRTAVIFSLIPIIFGIGQLFFPDAAMYSLGFMFASITIYSFNVTAQREEFFEDRAKKQDSKHASIINGLAGNYEEIYYIDLDGESYEGFIGSNSAESGLFEKVSQGSGFFRVIPEETLHKVFEEDREAYAKNFTRENILHEMEGKSSFNYTYRIDSENGPLYYEARFFKSFVPGEEEKLIVGICCVDDQVREEMEYRDALRDAQRQAVAANEAKTTFLFNMSHDIRTPMNAILGFTDMARRNIGDRDRVLDCLQKVRMAGDHLLTLINEVLDMARIESGKTNVNVEVSDLTTIGGFILSLMGKTAEEHDVSLHANTTNIKNRLVEMDKLHVNQIMVNIISNSIKYTKPGGKVDFIVEEIPEPLNGIGKYRFTITDTGIGMSQEFLTHIFESFSREETATISGIEGTGLGMSITKKLVDQLGGTIDIQSEVNKGTTTVIELPLKLAESAANREGENTKEEEKYDFSGKKVLLVEDNELNLEIAGDLLEESGFEVDTAEDGTIAVEKMKRAEPGQYNLILMDIQMPRMNGYDATRAIRALERKEIASIPIIAMTANAFEEDKKNAFDAGMNAHVAKPINLEELLPTIARYIR